MRQAFETARGRLQVRAHKVAGHLNGIAPRPDCHTVWSFCVVDFAQIEKNRPILCGLWRPKAALAGPHKFAERYVENSASAGDPEGLPLSAVIGGALSSTAILFSRKN